MPSTTGDTTTALTLPHPPNSDPHWSVVTLAAHLCVPPSAVDAHLALPDESGDSPDFHSIRYGGTYADASGEWLGDCYLYPDAAERIAAALPTGLLARQVVNNPTALYGLELGEVVAMAQHIVTHLGDPA